jgi:tetratricopeptide (TPR) repeat protein
MKCPVCTATYRPPSSSCRRCGADLAALIRIHDQALWHYRQALQLFKVEQFAEALAQTEQAIALHQGQADFHVLAGQLWAVQGKFAQAVQCWQTAQRLDPKHSIAANCLTLLANR